ncbi:hypothetical protein OSB04_018568 [Centaurea solstitialis]|uniref:Peptidase M3A/M3B catalytic domain-containing protein n=1 Tax=Centaurea solstitialis TaxID=347529 RepID=A0AA38TCN0_9ASTR|nr:hypothetical protein OSB04_018568 [Centaurea solstitialis]
MATQKGDRKNLLAITGAAAFAAVAVKFAIDAINSKRNQLKKQGLRGCNVRVNLSPSEMLKLADRLVANSKAVHDAVASVPLDKVSYTNVILPLEQLEAYQFPLVQSCVFPKFVSSSEEIRKASAEAGRRIDAHVSACSQREDVYRVVKAFAAKGEWTSMELKRYTQFLVRDFERNGMNLTLTKREELQRLRAQIDELSMRYIQNLNDDKSFLLFDQSELLGLPPEFLKSLDMSENEKYKIRLRSHHVSAVLDLCKVGLTRRAVAVQLRHKSARLLGYTNYAILLSIVEWQCHPSKVFEFLEDISASLNDLASRELTLLKDIKTKEEGEIPFGIEDLPYYVKKVEEEQFDLDFEAVKQYFPVCLVQSGIFKVCQDLFGLRFEKVDDAEVWHSDVHFFQEGKYGQTCVIPLQNSSLTNGSRQIPVALLVTQIKKEVDGDPVLLRFSEVLKLFHEFGHVVHHICNVRLLQNSVDCNLILTLWRFLPRCFEAASLKLISGFHQDITKPINDDVCKSLKRWRSSFSALKLKQEILYCLFDQIIHSTENVDIVGLFKHLHPKVMLGLPMLEGTSPASCSPSSAIGCEAACYSHIWSQVFAADIYASKFRDDIFNQHTGMQFRNKVLAPGGSKEPIELLSDFLGREPSVQAFVDSKSETFNDASFR